MPVEPSLTGPLLPRVAVGATLVTVDQSVSVSVAAVAVGDPDATVRRWPDRRRSVQVVLAAGLRADLERAVTVAVEGVAERVVGAGRVGRGDRDRGRAGLVAR